MNDLKHFIELGVQFAYPFYWKKWEVIHYYAITFKYKLGVISGRGIDGTLFHVADKKLPKLKIIGIGPHKESVPKALDYDNLQLIIDSPERASKEFKDDSVDFVFIDDCSDYESMKKSLNIWESKVHEYGLIMGHNYNHGDIARAVGEYFNEVWVLPDNVWAGSKVWLRDDRKTFNR